MVGWFVVVGAASGATLAPRFDDLCKGLQVVGIISERMAATAKERLDGVASGVRLSDDEGDAVERAARRLAKFDPKARVANVLVEVEAKELAELCQSVEASGADEALLAVAKVIGRGASEVVGRIVAVRADQLLALAAVGTV